MMDFFNFFSEFDIKTYLVSMLAVGLAGCVLLLAGIFWVGAKERKECIKGATIFFMFALIPMLNQVFIIGGLMVVFLGGIVYVLVTVFEKVIDGFSWVVDKAADKIEKLVK
jgi:hypothetical protein